MDAAYTQARRRATPRHAMPCHAVRIIKRNYCRSVVNNALLLKRVPATARGILRAAVDCVGKSRVRDSDAFSPSRLGSFSTVDLDLTLLSSWRSSHERESAVRMAPAASHDLFTSHEGREKSYFDRTAWYARRSAMFRDRGISAAVGTS